MISHPWHMISTGKDAPESVNAIIEIARDSKAKYELDKETGLLRLDRILRTNLRYPFHYGFIPRTLCDDADPLDILILCSEHLIPHSIVEATILGAVNMIDNGEQDDKIIAVATHDPYMKDKKNLQDISDEVLNNIRYFFENYKKEEGKEVIIQGFLDKKPAQTIVTESINFYKETFEK